jgi:hypothetical protein
VQIVGAELNAAMKGDLHPVIQCLPFSFSQGITPTAREIAEGCERLWLIHTRNFWHRLVRS